MIPQRTKTLRNRRGQAVNSRNLPRDQSGFSLLELLLVVVIMGIVANLAIPSFQKAQERARAQKIVGDFIVFRTAVTDYYTRNNQWPKNQTAGVMPPELSDYLGDRLQWKNPPTAVRTRLKESEYYLDWTNWSDQPSRTRQTGVVVGFSVKAKDVELKKMIEEAWGSPLVWYRHDKIFFPVETRGTVNTDRYRPK